MQDRTYADDVAAGEPATVAGWVHEIRDLGGIAFLILRDKSGKLQIKLEKDEMDDELVETGLGVHRESVISVTGDVKEEPRAPTGFELVPESIDVIAEADAELPLDPSGKVEAELPTRLDNRTLDLRKPEVKAIFEIRAEVLRAARETFRDLNATEINTPKIVATGTEGGTELFPITYFGEEAFMNQSPQLFKQLMAGSGLETVFEIGPIFRAEEHNTPRHLNEATSIDFESAFADHHDAMDAAEEIVVSAYEAVAENCADELEALGYKELVAGFEQQGLDPEQFEYYTKMFKYGMPPHAGWGMGGERLVMTMLGLENIREAVLFPRDRQRLSP